MAGEDIYCGDQVLTEDDTYIDASDTVRLHKEGDNLVVQIKVGDSWVDQVTLGT